MTLNDGAKHAHLMGEHEAKGKRAQTPEERKKAQALWAKNKRAEKRAAKENGTVVTKTKAEKPPKEPKAPKLPKSAKKMEKLIQAATDSGDQDAIAIANRMCKRWDDYQGKKGRLKEVTTSAGQRLKAENEKFEAVVTAVVPKGDTDSAVAQLAKIHIGWADLSEVRVQNSEERKAAKEDVQKALKLFERTIEEHRQMTLPGVSED